MGNIQEKLISFFREKILPVFSTSKDEDDSEEDDEDEEEIKKKKRKWRKGNKKRKRKKRKKENIIGNKKIVLKTDEDEVIVTDEKNLWLLYHDLCKASKLLENKRDEMSDRGLNSSTKKHKDYSTLKENSTQKKHDMDDCYAEYKVKKFSSNQKISKNVGNKILGDDSSSEDEIKYKHFNRKNHREKETNIKTCVNSSRCKNANQGKTSKNESDSSDSDNEYKQIKSQQKHSISNLFKNKNIKSDVHLKEKSRNESDSSENKNDSDDSVSESESGEDYASSSMVLTHDKKGETRKTDVKLENNDKITQNSGKKQNLKSDNNRITNHRKLKPRRKILKQNWRSFSDIDEEEEEKFNEEENKDIHKVVKLDIRNELKSPKQEKNILREINNNGSETRGNKFHLEKTSVRKLAELFSKEKVNEKEEAINMPSKSEDILESFSKETDKEIIQNIKQNETNSSDLSNSVNALFKNTSEKILSILRIGKLNHDHEEKGDYTSKDTDNKQKRKESIEGKEIFKENIKKEQINENSLNNKETRKTETEWSKDFRDGFEANFKNILEKFKQKENKNERNIREITAKDKLSLVQDHSDDIQMDNEALRINETDDKNIKATFNDNCQEFSHVKVQKSNKHKLKAKYFNQNTKEEESNHVNLKEEFKEFSENNHLKENIPREGKSNVQPEEQEEKEKISEGIGFEKCKYFKKMNIKAHLKSIRGGEESGYCEKEDDVVSPSKHSSHLLEKDDTSSNSRSLLHKRSNYKKLSESSSSSDDFEMLDLDSNSSIKIKSTGSLSSNSKEMIIHTDASKEKEREKPKLQKKSKYNIFKTNVEKESDKTNEESSDEFEKTGKKVSLISVNKFDEEHEDPTYKNKHIDRKLKHSNANPDKGRVKSLTRLAPWRRHEENESDEDEDEDDYNYSKENYYKDLESGLLAPSNKIIEKLIKKKKQRKLNEDEEELLDLYVQNMCWKQKSEEVKKPSEKGQKGKSFWRNRKMSSSDDSDDYLVERFSSKNKTEIKLKTLGKLYRKDESSDGSEEMEEATIKKGKHKVLESKDSESAKNKNKHKTLKLRFRKSSEDSEEESVESPEEKGFTLNKEESLRLLKVSLDKTKRRMKGESSESEEIEEEVSKFSKLSSLKFSKIILKEEEKEPVKRGIFGRKIKQKKKSRFERVFGGKASKKKKKRKIKRRMCSRVTKMVVRSASKRAKKRILGDQPKKKKSAAPVKTNKTISINQKEPLGKKSKTENLDSKKTPSKPKPKTKRAKKKLQKQKQEDVRKFYS